jgi:hypothetical protein
MTKSKPKPDQKTAFIKAAKGLASMRINRVGKPA